MPMLYVGSTRFMPLQCQLTHSVLCRIPQPRPTHRPTSPLIPSKLRSMAASSVLAAVTPGSFADKAVGCILAALCGDALGAAVEGWSIETILRKYPGGLTTFQDCHDRMGRGRYTDDGQMLLALAASLINQRGKCIAADAATQYAKAFDPRRGYGQSAQQILARLQLQLEQGPLPATTGSELFGQGGSYGNGGAMRIAPVGLVYRNAPTEVLEAAVRQALVPTHHVHPLAVEGALAQALAVAELGKMQPGHDYGTASSLTAGQSSEEAAAKAPAGAEGGCGNWPGSSAAAPAAALELLRVLRGKLDGKSQEMCDKIEVLEQGLHKLYQQHGGPRLPSQSWESYFGSPAWSMELAVSASIAEGFQIKGTEAAASALWACVAHWGRDPADAIIAAVHYGGDTDTIACMAGALVGALHGSTWLPPTWLAEMEQAKDEERFFNIPAVDVALAAVSGSVSQQYQQQLGQQQQQQPQHIDNVLVHTTANMGRDGAVRLGCLLAQLGSGLS